jgi:hypothetical protein
VRAPLRARSHSALVGRVQIGKLGQSHPHHVASSRIWNGSC